MISSSVKLAIGAVENVTLYPKVFFNSCFSQFLFLIKQFVTMAELALEKFGGSGAWAPLVFNFIMHGVEHFMSCCNILLRISLQFINLF